MLYTFPSDRERKRKFFYKHVIRWQMRIGSPLCKNKTDFKKGVFKIEFLNFERIEKLYALNTILPKNSSLLV